MPVTVYLLNSKMIQVNMQPFWMPNHTLTKIKLNESGNSTFMGLHWKCLVKSVKHRRWRNYNYLSASWPIINGIHSQNWYSRWGRRFYFKVAAESFPSWDTIRDGFFLFRIRFHFQQWLVHYEPEQNGVFSQFCTWWGWRLHPCKETTTFIINCNGIYFSSRSKLLTFSHRKLSTSSFILNFSECRTCCPKMSAVFLLL